MKSRLDRLPRMRLAAFAIVGVAVSLNAVAVEPGEPAPNCRLTPIDGGQSWALRQYRGKVLYVDFWASWCGPCAQSFPFMNQLARDFGGRGLEILAINLDEEPADAKAFLAEHPAGFTILSDAGGQCPQEFGVRAMPSSYLVDRNGMVHHVQVGFRAGESDKVRAAVEALLVPEARATR